MTLTLDDTGEKTKLTITNGSKTLLKRKGKSILSLLRFVYSGSKKKNVKETIAGLQPMHKLMLGSKTTIKIGE